MSIYVEIRVRGPMEEIWERTQDPARHERWDLRFTEIQYLPRCQPEQPQRFRYATRIGFGLRIEGEGEAVGSRNGAQGERTSALQFWSADRKSLILEGSGYWKYIPTEDGIRFLTWYDYRTRFGAPGRVLDRLLFRPLMGWATAWSFDRLRLWIEQDLDPGLALERSLVHASARTTLALIFLYHGLVPKLLVRHPDELAMLAQTGVPLHLMEPTLTLLGLAELVWGLLLLLLWRSRWPFLVTVAVMLLALVAVALHSPQYLSAAFNPVTLNLAVIALSLIAWLVSTDLPSAARCLRTRPREG
jgi:uncharacterized membrane protein YphA (DoxX/SURF4 family)